MSCYKTSDNKYPQCPAKMSDGRNFTDYRQRYKVHNLNDQVIKKSAHEYRQYLINNTDKLMNMDRFKASKKNGCFPCVSKTTMLPEKTIKVCDKRTCKVMYNDSDGLGQGRKYVDSVKDFCNTFISKSGIEEEENKCVDKSNDLFEYYGL